jgi:transposase
MLARRRHHTFFALLELNTAMTALLGARNRRPFKTLSGSRQSVCESLDRPALRPLPAQPYAYAEWTLVRVNIDSHVEVAGHYDSVPYRLVTQPLEVRRSAQVVEIFPKGKRVASHQRSPLKGRHSTVAAHMPTAPRRYAEWTPQRLMLWAAKTGEATAHVVDTMLASRPPPQQGFCACLGIMRLGKSSGEGRLEAACQQAIRLGACAYKRIESMLTHARDRQPFPPQPAAATVRTHGNIRGPK